MPVYGLQNVRDLMRHDVCKQGRNHSGVYGASYPVHIDGYMLSLVSQRICELAWVLVPWGVVSDANNEIRLCSAAQLIAVPFQLYAHLLIDSRRQDLCDLDVRISANVHADGDRRFRLAPAFANRNAGGHRYYQKCCPPNAHLLRASGGAGGNGGEKRPGLW